MLRHSSRKLKRLWCRCYRALFARVRLRRPPFTSSVAVLGRRTVQPSTPEKKKKRERSEQRGEALNVTTAKSKQLTLFVRLRDGSVAVSVCLRVCVDARGKF